jgi:hypothetical protein
MKNGREADSGRLQKRVKQKSVRSRQPGNSSGKEHKPMIAEIEMDKMDETMGTVFLDPDQKEPSCSGF